MQVSILGPLLVEDGAQPVEIGGARLRALLIRLAADPGRWVALFSLAAALWADDMPNDEVNALQSLVSRLRRVLPDPGVVESGPAGYRLVVPPEAVDAVRFERKAVEGRRLLAVGRAADAVAALNDGLALWRGVALADVADVAYAAAWAQKLDELRLGAVDDRIEAELELGRHRDLVAELEDLTARDPLRERTRGLLLRALSGSGRQADALASYEQLRRILADELGLDPSPQLQEVHLAVLRGETIGAAAAEPAPRAARRSNLRSALTSFVGREDDVRQLRELLTRSRLVTLVGAGGAGKTRLAGEVAGGLNGVGESGVWMVELAPITDPNDVASATLGSIRSTETATLERTTAPSHRDALTRLVETLADHRVLLILDNCEHLVDAAAKLAEQLLGQCPGLTVLATSREPLGIMGESLWPVRPLPAPDSVGDSPDLAGVLATPAVKLFADRGALVRPGFAVTAANVVPVVEICRRLDGLPLAIELAAARLRSLPVDVVAARLSDRFRLLAGGSRTAMPRHQTLRAVVAWSWDLLTESERRLAERLSVFTGGATAETAEAVCSHVDEPAAGAGDAAVPADEAPDLLVALADKSLLVVVEGPASDDGGPRYRMLETIREFSTERLAERGEIDRLRAIHAKYFLDLAERAEPQLRGAGQLAALDQLTAERDNLLAALRHAVEVGDADTAVRLGAALSWYWTLRGRHDEAAIWLELALSVPGETSPSAYLLVRVVHTLSAAAAGQVMPREEETSEFVRLAHELDTTEAHPLISLIEPAIALLRDEGEAGQAAIDRNLKNPDPWARAMLHMMRAAMAENDGELERLESSLPVARRSFEEIGDRWGVAAAISSQAMLIAGRGDVESAIADLQTARRLMTELQSNEDESYTLIRIAAMRMRIGDLVGARRDLELAERTAERIGNQWGTVAARLGRGMLARYEGDEALGRRLATEAVSLSDLITIGPPQLRGSTCASAAMFDARAGDLDLARSRLATAYEATITSRDMPVGALVAIAAAEVLAIEGRPELAAGLIGVATQLRGYPDVTDPEYMRIRQELENRLGAAQYGRRYDAGAHLSRAEALALLKSVVADAQAPDPEPRTSSVLPPP